ncbi:MAG: Antitoxin Phd YefM, type toxin-antitoxin system [Verrucomicrobiota bacterium]|jgi:prevent-host-death family protein
MTISATHFKARCLELMTRVDRTGGAVTITRHGRPVARLLPVEKPAKKVPGPVAMYGFAKTFRKTRSTAAWMKILRAGEKDQLDALGR